MSRIASKYIRFGTSTGDVSSQNLPANFTPSNYTPVAVASEGTDKVSSNLKGIDNKLGASINSNDISDTTFTAADNQSSPANVTGLAFANGTIRSFKAHVSVVRNTTYAAYDLMGIQKGSSWEMSQSSVGDVTGLVFTITTAGQCQYTSTSTGSTATLHFRAQVLGV